MSSVMARRTCTLRGGARGLHQTSAVGIACASAAPACGPLHPKISLHDDEIGQRPTMNATAKHSSRWQGPFLCTHHYPHLLHSFLR